MWKNTVEKAGGRKEKPAGTDDDVRRNRPPDFRYHRSTHIITARYGMLRVFA